MAEWINTNLSSFRLPNILEFFFMRMLSAGGFSPKELSGNSTNLAVKGQTSCGALICFSVGKETSLCLALSDLLSKFMAEISARSLDVLECL